MINPVLFDSHPWLEEHLEKSVTEMEIFYGVLRNPSMNERAFFYFRDPEYTPGNENADDFTEADSELTKRLKHTKGENKIITMQTQGKLPKP